MVNEALRRRVQAWIDGDPDPVDRAELERALERGDEPLLAQRFAGRLSFGTAGLRGPIGAGPHAMNTAVIRQTCHGLADVLSAGGADPARVVIGFDARHRSSAFALESAAVLRAWVQGVPVGQPGADTGHVILGPSPGCARRHSGDGLAQSPSR